MSTRKRGSEDDDVDERLRVVGDDVPEDPPSDVAQRLRDARRALGLTQQEVADRLGVSRRAVSEWETGIRQPHTSLPALSALYDVSASFLLYGVEPSSVELRELREIVVALALDVTSLREDVERLAERADVVRLAEQTAAAFADLRALIEHEIGGP